MPDYSCQHSAGRVWQTRAAPLRRGSPLCLFHARPFCTQSATVDGPVVILYLDLVPVFAAKKSPSPVLHHAISLVEHVFESMGNHGR